MIMYKISFPQFCVNKNKKPFDTFNYWVSYQMTKQKLQAPCNPSGVKEFTVIQTIWLSAKKK